MDLPLFCHVSQDGAGSVGEDRHRHGKGNRNTQVTWARFGLKFIAMATRKQTVQAKCLTKKIGPLSHTPTVRLRGHIFFPFFVMF